MTAVTNRSEVLSVEKNIQNVTSSRKGEKYADVRQEFGLVNSMIRTILKNGTKIFSVFQQNESRTKRFRKPEGSDNIETPLKWFKQQKSENIPVSGLLIKLTFVIFKL
jgi:hypothetical protein